MVWTFLHLSFQQFNEASNFSTVFHKENKAASLLQLHTSNKSTFNYRIPTRILVRLSWRTSPEHKALSLILFRVLLFCLYWIRNWPRVTHISLHEQFVSNLRRGCKLTKTEHCNINVIKLFAAARLSFRCVAPWMPEMFKINKLMTRAPDLFFDSAGAAA